MFGQEWRKVAKYAVVGVMNTLITYVGFLLLRYAGMGLDAANALSYAAGMANGFVMNRRWTFGAGSAGWHREAMVYTAGCAACWAVQWLAFRALLLFLPEWAAMGAAMCLYTAAGYVFNRRVTFRRA